MLLSKCKFQSKVDIFAAVFQHFGNKCFVSSVPAAVTSLKAQCGNQSDALWVNWDRSAGDLSGYLLTLYNPDGSQQAEEQLGSEVTQFVFRDLVPGRLYQAVVLSLSGELANRAGALGRTGETQRQTGLLSLERVFKFLEYKINT